MRETWQKFSKDPNNLDAQNAVIAALKKARCRVGVNDRVKFLCEQVKGKEVLDVGIVEHTERAESESDWLHGRLRESAKSILGIDILTTEVDALKGKGYNVIVHDIVATPLEEKFEIAVCGDVLEHIDNPGRFVGNLEKSLKAGGRVFVSLPNPWYLNYLIKALFNGSQYVESADHVAWYDANTLVELFGRQGFELVSYRGIIANKSTTFKSRTLFYMVPMLLKCGLKHELFSKTMVYEFGKI